MYIRFKKSDFFINVTTLLTGTAIAQVIPIIVSPILARLYAPNDFGVLALFMAVAGFISIVITGQYESAILLPKDDDGAVNIIALSLLITFFISILSLCVIIIYNYLYTTHIKNDLDESWLLLIPASVLLTGLYQVFNYWCIRKKMFKTVAIRQIFQSVSSSLFKILFIFINKGPAGLVLGTLFGQLTATSVLGYIIYRDYSKSINLISKEKIKESAKKYSDFPKYNAPQAFMDIFRQNGVVLMISSFFGMAVLGLYSMAMSMILLPMRFIGNSIGQVFYQKTSCDYNNNIDIWPGTIKVIRLLFIIGLLPFAILLIFGPDLFALVFGSQWRSSGSYAQVLTPWIFVNFISSPISVIPIILGKQKQFFYISIGYNLLIPLSFLIANLLNFPIIKSLGIISFIGGFYLLFEILWMRAQVIELRKIKQDY